MRTPYEKNAARRVRDNTAPRCVVSQLLTYSRDPGLFRCFHPITRVSNFFSTFCQLSNIQRHGRPPIQLSTFLYWYYIVSLQQYTVQLPSLGWISVVQKSVKNYILYLNESDTYTNRVFANSLVLNSTSSITTTVILSSESLRKSTRLMRFSYTNSTNDSVSLYGERMSRRLAYKHI